MISILKQTITTIKSNTIAERLLDWKVTYNMKDVVLAILSFAFIACWLGLLINYGQAYLKSALPALIIITCIAIIKAIEVSKK